MPENFYQWCAKSVAGILERREYTGCTVNFKTYTKSLKFKNRMENQVENQQVFEDTQPAIIDSDSGNGYRNCGRTNADRPKQEEPACSPASSTAPTAEPSCTSAPAIPTRRQPEPFRLLQLQEQHRLLPNPLYPGTGALSDRAGNHTADIELCPYVPEGFQAGNAGAGRGKPQGRTGGKTESPLRGEKTDGGFGQDYPAYL